MDFTLEVEQEEDGRWIAEVPELPGTLAYGASSDEASVRAETLALRVIADRLENGEASPSRSVFSLRHERLAVGQGEKSLGGPF